MLISNYLSDYFTLLKTYNTEIKQLIFLTCPKPPFYYIQSFLKIKHHICIFSTFFCSFLHH